MTTLPSSPCLLNGTIVGIDPTQPAGQRDLVAVRPNTLTLQA
jgi:hypothetical protein